MSRSDCGCGSGNNFMLLPGDPAAIDYSSLAATNRPIIVATYQSGSHVPSDLYLTLTMDGQSPTKDFSTTGHAAGDNYLLPIQLTTPITATGRYYFTLDLKVTINGVASHLVDDGFRDVIVNNNIFGAGWILSDDYGSLTTISATTNASGAFPAGILLGYGEGQSDYFQQNPDGSYSSADTYATLTKDGSGNYTLNNSGHEYKYNSSGQIIDVL